MYKDPLDILMAYVALVKTGDNDMGPRAFAKAQGWLTEDGALTPSGRETAAAFLEQEQSRSAFRIG